MSGIHQHPSPNFGPRRGGLRPSLIVLHYTAMISAEAALERLCDEAAEVSCHYLIARDGAAFQLVEEDMRAWHAGTGAWDGQDDINSRSIGIEIDNAGTHPFGAAQMDALERLLRGVMARWAIAPKGVIGHSDMAPGRKTDPGPRFDWARLERQGLAASPQDRYSGEVSEDSFRIAARAAGHTADADFATLLASVRARRAPWRQGPLIAADYCI